VRSNLSAFDRVVCDLVIDNRVRLDYEHLPTLLDELDAARKGEVKGAGSRREVEVFLESAKEELTSLWSDTVAPLIVRVQSFHKELRTSPQYKRQPTLILAGSPNVGKSSLIRRLSSGKPEVAEYSFTTKNVQLGHRKVPMSSGAAPTECQVMDSPGVLARPGGMNAMESLTVESCRLLPAAVMWVWDVTKPYADADAGEQASTVETQMRARKIMRDMFPKRPWIDVIAKADLGVDPRMRAGVEEAVGKEVQAVSSVSGEGMERLEGDVDGLLREVAKVLEYI